MAGHRADALDSPGPRLPSPSPLLRLGAANLAARRESLVVLLPVLVAIVGLGAYTATQSSVFLTWSNFVAILTQVSALGIIAVGMTLLMVAGLLDVSVGAAASFISIVAAKLVTGGSTGLVTVLACLLIGAVVGLVFGAIVASTHVDVFIFTLGAMSVFSSFALIAAGGQPVPTDDAYSGLAFNKLAGVPYAVLTMLGLAAAAAFLLRYTRLGRNAYAVGSSEEAAFIAGIPVTRVKVTLFVLSGLLVGVAAIVLLSRLGAGDPRAGMGLELQAIAAVILGGGALAGGRGSVLGTLLGVFLLGEVQNALNILNVDSTYQNVVQGGILMFAVVFMAINAQRRAGKRLQLPGVLLRSGRR